MLQLRVGHPIKKLPETIDLVTLRDRHENRKPHIQNSLDDVQLLRNFARLFLNRVRRIFDQAVGRDYEKEPIDWTIRPVLFEQGKKLAPLARFTGFNLLEHEPTSGIQKDRMVRKPPIHVDCAADSLKLVLHSRGETHVAVPNRLRFSRAGLSHNDIPGQLVQILASRLIGLDARLEFFTHVVQPRPLPWITQSSRCGRTMLGYLTPELLVLLFLLPGFPPVIPGGNNRQQYKGN